MLDQWAAAGKPKAQVLLAIPAKPHPQAQIDGTQWVLPPLKAIQEQRIAQINAECTRRLIARYGTAEEQVSRALGIYGAAERDAMEAGISATIDASNTASDAVINAATVAQAEAVTVTWPALP